MIILPKIMSANDISQIHYYLEVESLIWEYMHFAPLINHLLYIFIELDLLDLLMIAMTILMFKIYVILLLDR